MAYFNLRDSPSVSERGHPGDAEDVSGFDETELPDGALGWLPP
jgi:hypothetical protein